LLNKALSLSYRGFIAIVKHSEKLTILVEMMYCGQHYKHLPCFERGISLQKLNQIGQATINELKQRFHPRENMKAHDYMEHVDMLIEQSLDNWRTKWYDKYQYYFQGIFY